MDCKSDVRAWLADRAGEMAALLADLVAIETENPPGRHLGRCGRVLRDAMSRLGISADLIALPPTAGLEEPCIVRGQVGEGARIIYFHGHFDVVPAQDPGQFAPRRRDGRISGRGTADTKGGIVSM
ncbi:MAG: M20/M25/M40 family metallo-hydrolase, partial [Chloroflexi bacterium]|nr:M20/M25/M40 family metallo-hydrolase [Chloroflexota bacterium]